MENTCYSVYAQFTVVIITWFESQMLMYTLRFYHYATSTTTHLKIDQQNG